MQNILFVNYSLGIGGIETLLLEHCKYLNKLNRYKLFFITFETAETNLKKEYQEQGVTLIELSKKEGIDFSITTSIVNAVRKYKIDFMHAHNQATWLYVAMASIISRKPFLMTIHTGTDKFTKKQEKRWVYFSRLLSYLTPKITTVAKYLEYDLIKIGISKKRILTIHNGIDINRFTEKKSKDAADKSSILMVARFSEQKNHCRLISAMAIVKKHNPEIKLYLAGVGELMGQCKELVRSLDLNDTVIFLGYNSNVKDLLYSKQVYILPSIIEGLSISLLEAMSCKKSIIASAIPSNMEVISDNDTGLLVDPFDENDIADKIIYMFKNDETAQRMGSNAYNSVNKSFTFDLMMNKYISIYDNFV